MRILFAQPKSTFREAIPHGLTANPVLEALGLPQCSFASFQLSSGVFSLHTIPEGSTIDKCTKLRFVFRTPQKAECSTGGISLCHDVATGMTTALALGYSFSLEDPKTTTWEALEPISRQLRMNWALWTHPLLLPSTFLNLHTIRVKRYIYDTLNHDVMSLERCIGVTKAGRPDDAQFGAKGYQNGMPQGELFKNDRGEQRMQRNIAKELTTLLNDLSTSILFTKRSPKWDMDCSMFLIRLLGESKRLQNHGSIPGQQFEQTLEYVHIYSEALAEATETFQARLRLQLNIVSIVDDSSYINPADLALLAIHCCCPRRWPDKRTTGDISRQRQYIHENPCTHYGRILARYIRFSESCNVYQLTSAY